MKRAISIAVYARRPSLWFAGICILILVLGGPIELCRAGEDTADPGGMHAAVWVQRQQIISGRFEIGEVSRQFGSDGAVLSIDTSYVIELSGTKTRFDRDGDALISRDEDRFVAAMSAPDRIERLNDLLASGVVKRERRRVLYVETERQNYLYMHKGKQLQVNIKADAAKRAAQFFDVKMLGLIAAPSPTIVASGAVKITGNAIETIDNRNVLRIEFLSAKGTRTTIFFDTESPVVNKIEGISSDGHTSTVIEIENLADAASGVVFPKQVTTRKYQGASLVDETVVTVNKAAINVPIDESEMTPERFRMAMDTTIVDENTQRLLAMWDGTTFVRQPGMKGVDQATLDLIHGTTSQPAQ